MVIQSIIKTIAMYKLAHRYLERLKKKVWLKHHLTFISQKSHSLFLLLTCLSCNLKIQNKWKTLDSKNYKNREYHMMPFQCAWACSWLIWVWSLHAYLLWPSFCVWSKSFALWARQSTPSQIIATAVTILWYHLSTWWLLHFCVVISSYTI